MNEEKPKKPKDPKKPLRNWVALTGIAFQMGATIFLCAWGGKKLDTYYELEKSWFTMGFVLFGVGASLYLVLQQLKKLNK